MKTKIILMLTICFLAITANSQTEAVKIPAEITPFVEQDTRPIALESADLNGDGLKDYILVLERENPTEKDEYDYPKNQRPLLILVRSADKKLTEAKRNENIVMCSRCGGVMGDPFMGVTVGKNTFTVNHYGGSAWRWTADYKFNYSRIDKTWQLVRIEKTSFHATDQNKTLKRKIMTPPKDFGKVDIADFDPADFAENADEETNLTQEEIKELLPAGTRLLHPAVMGKFGGPNSGGQNEPSADSWTKYVLLYSKDDPVRNYKIKVNVPAGFETFDSYDLPEPGFTWSIMEPLAVFFANADRDSENELFIPEQCMTGIGPTGAQYFYRTRVYDWDGKSFRYLETVSEKIGNLNTAAKVRQKLPEIIKTTSPETAGSFQNIDISGFNRQIEKAAKAGENWVKMPTQVVARMLGQFSEIRSRTIEMNAPNAESINSLSVTVIDDGFLDDSMRGEKHKFELKNDEQGIWKFVSAEKSWRCQEGRGHQDFSTANCL